jgi:hypothetical protein
VKPSALSPWVVCLLIIGLCIVPSASLAQETVGQYFAETGYTVRGEFLQFFNQWGGIDVFGSPISQELLEDGVRVQYFQNSRLEWHPENLRPYRVQPGLLGELLSARQPPIPSAQIPLASRIDERYYPETGHSLKGGFLKFFDQHGGIDIFGYPLSEVVPGDNGRLVQWFQRGQLQWNPNDLAGQIKLAPLGELALKQRHPEISAPAMPAASLGMVSGTEPVNIMVAPSPGDLRVSASVQNALTGGQSGGAQRVFVFVTDENDNAIPNATVVLTVSYPSGSRRLTMPPTDRTGFTSVSFDIGNVEPSSKLVVVATASYGNRKASTETSFLSWY